MQNEPHGGALRRLLDRVDPDELEEILAEFIVAPSHDAAVSIHAQWAARPRTKLLEGPQGSVQTLGTGTCEERLQDCSRIPALT
jgi:hypothetical protein